MPFPSCARRGRLRRAMLGGALLIWPLLAAAQAGPDLPLGRGDRVRLAVTGLPSLDIEAVVSEAGLLDLLWVGRLEALGRTTDDLEDELRQRSEGLLVKQYGMDGRLFIIQLEGGDVNLTRTAHAPVIVAGSVAQPGQVAFSPGMTVREALSLAGGIDTAILGAGRPVDATVVLRWQSDFVAAATTHADAVARLWRIEADLAGNADLPLPPANKVRATPEAFAEMVGTQRALLAVHWQADAAQRAFLAEARRQALARLEIL